MNMALIHNRSHVQTFWENKISSQCQNAESEEQRMKRSALKKLKGEWLIRLESRNKHLKSLTDDASRKPSADWTGAL